MKFNEYFRTRRIANNMTLRFFCNRFGFDPAYISRLETEKLKPPEEQDKLKALALALDIKEDTADWVKFFDLAYESRSEIPEDIKKNVPQIISLLPIFLRTKDNKKISKEKVQQLLDFLTNRKK